ncbi:6-phosphogluconolactonase [Pullulanibacillus pueri]|uniref:3-carboxymuconate cyclase n=1 Tax=Pullulanibacillus pueri TaxID=1437324 RepID=A0A8J3ENF7_9BACL|nr:lactonase family protein [Pullulanibacillus pueri]MBM7682871.1 6-phosphogluconolactonase [Pullulanibacillus pueri]GGH84344.1 3-carboxymuconate cyclase [Pullulanibacillus pueri]
MGQKQEGYYIFVGTYLSDEDEAIQLLLFDPDGEGTLTKVSGVKGIKNPSYLTLDQKGQHLYAVSEIDEGQIVSYSFDKEEKVLKEINRKPTLGSAPCYVSIDNEQQRVFIVNYMGGSICQYPLEADGAVGDVIDCIKHSGHSVHPERQEGPHPHTIVTIPGTTDRLVTDLGTDHLYVYRSETPDGHWSLHDEVDVVPGSGPRHVAFHPTQPVIYVIQELKSSITVYRQDEEGTLALVETVSTLPKGFTDENTASDIHVSEDGHFLYASNRGHDSIAAFQIGEKGTLDCIGHTATLGQTPRNFLLIPNSDFMLVANQDSDTIVVMKITTQGLPKPTGSQYTIEKPVCLQVLP